MREALEAAGGTLLYLPPYSPDFNPIEQLFAKLKALLRKATERSVDGLWNRIARLLDAFPQDECANYLRNAGDWQRRKQPDFLEASQDAARGHEGTSSRRLASWSYP